MSMMIKMIVNRCHVAESNLSVIRYVITRLADNYATWKTLTKKQRKTMMRQIIKAHAGNGHLYHYVMNGQ